MSVAAGSRGDAPCSLSAFPESSAGPVRAGIFALQGLAARRPINNTASLRSVADDRGTGRPVAATDETHHLRILIANEKRERLERLAAFIATLGHEVIAREIHVSEVAASTAREHPDVALVGLGSSTEHALDLISEIVREAACPVIALLERRDPAYVNEAATRGVFAYIVADSDPDELQMAIDITLRRFAEYQNLQGAFGRRAKIEQAKGLDGATRDQ